MIFIHTHTHTHNESTEIRQAKNVGLRMDLNDDHIENERMERRGFTSQTVTSDEYRNWSSRRIPGRRLRVIMTACRVLNGISHGEYDNSRS